MTAGGKRDEAGFTLIEILIVLGILPIIIGAISLSLIAVLSLNGGVSKNIADSSDAQVVSANFQLDVQSAAQLTTNPVSQCGTGTQLFGLEWTLNAQANAYQTLVSYVEKPNGSSFALLRQYCTSGASTTPTSTFTVSSDVPSSPVAPFTIAPSVDNASAATGWISTLGVTGVTFSITEPGSTYPYTLVADPVVNVPNHPSTVSTQNAGCGFATPGTGTNASTLCLVDFSNWNAQFIPPGMANYCNTPNVTGGTTPPPGSLPMSASIANTPFTMNFCLSVSSTDSNGNPVTTLPGSAYNGIRAVPLPTYASPPTSEAFLGNNGFYSGVPGDPALYQCSWQGTPPNCYNSPAEGETSTLYVTNIEVLDSTGNSASGWQLVTGDAESTDTGESIAWTTCPGITTVVTPMLGTGCVGTGTGTGSITNDPNLNVVWNTPPTSPNPSEFGNACNEPFSPPTNTQTNYFLQTPGTQSVECAATISSDKTGTVMLEALSPPTLTVNMVGGGLEGIFLGVLLP